MKRILFVDVRNTSRSQMAEAWFNQFAEGWAKANSCGTMPALQPDPTTNLVLMEAGMETRDIVPKPLYNALLTQSDIVVLMGKDVFMSALEPDYVWDFQDPTGRDAIHCRVQRDAIRNQVQELIVQLQRLHFTSQDADWIHPGLLQRELMTQQLLGL